MLWLKRRIGEAIRVGSSRLVITAKTQTHVSVNCNGKAYAIPLNSCHRFKDFTLHISTKGPRGLRYGIEAASEIAILREELL